MITIIKDPDNVYDENVDIVVNDKNTFIKSRLLIDDLKEGLKENVRIVIIRPSYYKFYEDLGEVEGWINVIEYSFEKAIENYKTDLDKVYIQKIEKFIDDKREVIRFFRDYDNNFSLDENLVIFIFDYGRQLLEIKNYNDLLRWLKNIINKGKTYWLDKRYKDLIIDNLKINLDIKIFDELFSISTISDIEKLQTSLVASYLFSKYPVSSKNLVNTRISLIDDIDVSEELVEGLIKTYPNIISHINITISSIKNKLSIFEEGDIDAFLDRTKGYLDEEWEWVWKHIRENFSINMNKELSKIALWLNNDRHRGKIEILIELLKFLQLKKACSVPVDINGWFEYYQNFYLKWFPNMNYKKNILKRLEELNECFVLSFIQEIKNYKNQMERKYQDFLFKNYPALLRDDYTNLKVIKQIQNYIVENKIFFFVIDGLKFELWNSIKSAFEKYEYFVENAQQECISVLPSITSISRTALITGRSYKTLLDEKKEEEFSFYISNEEKHLKRDFPSYSIVYARGGLSAIDRLLEHEAGIYTLIFSQADAIFHAADAISIEAMEPFLDNLINKLIEKINKYGDMIIVLATDHGSTLLKNAEKIEMNLPETIIADQQGNCVILKSNSFNEELYLEIQERIDSQKWYTIWRQDSSKFGLPKTINQDEIYAWLFPKSGYYYGRAHAGYSHGGLSLEETIIPYGIFRRQAKVFESLQIVLGESRLQLGEFSYLELTIYNPNIFRIKEININLPSVRISKNIRDLASKSKEKVILGFILQDKHCTGEYFKETITLKISFLNKCTEQTYRLSERVEQTVVNSINKQISKGRTLDF